MKINRFEIENVKRVKAVSLEPKLNGLTIIGGANGQGKTSVLDAIAWALGGDKFKPSMPQREGSVLSPTLKVVLDNGLVVERKGKNSQLTVTDPTGRKGGQQLLNEFVEQLALDLPKFLQATPREKADTLLRVIGVGDRLTELERKENDAYNRRRTIGQIADQKEKFAREMPYYDGMPKNLISAGELIKRQQEILARNGMNELKRFEKSQLEDKARRARDDVKRLTLALEEATKALNKITADLQIAEKDALELHDESTEELARDISAVETTNAKIRVNLDRDKAQTDANSYREQYDALTNELTRLREEKRALLNNANLPLKGLTIESGELRYNGFAWDNMSSSDQLRVAAAIVRAVNPKCGFVLIDKLEQLDANTLSEFGQWIEREGLQVIATRVSTGDECQIIIEDGEARPMQIEQMKTWKEGEF